MNLEPYKIHPSGYKTYSKRFKAECVARCLTENKSVSSVAVQHGMNPNVLHRWIKEYKDEGRHDLTLFNGSQLSVTVDHMDATNTSWLAVLPRQGQPATAPKMAISNQKVSNTVQNNSYDGISIEISSDNLKLNLSWPNTDHSGLASIERQLSWPVATTILAG